MFRLGWRVIVPIRRAVVTVLGHSFQASDGQPASDGQVHTLAGVPGRTGVCWYKRTAKTTEWLWHVP